jgi:hypothetical protein
MYFQKVSIALALSEFMPRRSLKKNPNKAGAAANTKAKTSPAPVNRIVSAFTAA